VVAPSGEQMRSFSFLAILLGRVKTPLRNENKKIFIEVTCDLKNSLYVDDFLF
jgi:hypothetical protein